MSDLQFFVNRNIEDILKINLIINIIFVNYFLFLRGDHNQTYTSYFKEIKIFKFKGMKEKNCLFIVSFEALITRYFPAGFGGFWG